MGVGILAPVLRHARSHAADPVARGPGTVAKQNRHKTRFGSLRKEKSKNDKKFSKKSFFGLIFFQNFCFFKMVFEQIGFWSMKMDIVGFGKFDFDGRFG